MAENFGQINGETMAPKDENVSNKPSGNNVNAVTTEDLNEIDSVNENLDSINNALDFIEQRTDNIRAQLLELLNSSREIRQSLQAENKGKDNESGDQASDEKQQGIDSQMEE